MFFNDTATTEIYTLSLHDALPISVVTAAALAFANGAHGKEAMILWPLFGITNQLLAALALLVVTMYLKNKGGLKFLLTAIPCLAMLIITNWAMVKNEMNFIESKNWLLAFAGAGIFILALWMAVETLIVFFTAVPRSRQL